MEKTRRKRTELVPFMLMLDFFLHLAAQGFGTNKRILTFDRFSFFVMIKIREDLFLLYFGPFAVEVFTVFCCSITLQGKEVWW